MKLSVAMATYNRAPMVCEAIQAVLAQSRLPDEIVVSDDASPDRTWEVIAGLAARDSRVQVRRMPENTGGVENWNAAMRATQGELIAWCSDDDRFTPNHLAASVAYLDGHPEIGMVHSGFIDAIESANGVRQQIPRPLRSTRPIVIGADNWIGYFIRYYDWPFHPSTLVMRREVWERTGEFDRAFTLADTDWFVRAAAVTRIALLPRHGVINRRHPDNWSNRLGSAFMHREIFQMIEKALALKPLLSRIFWRALWRANVRARVILSLRARLRSGHGDAARALWHVLLQATGRTTPAWIERLGARAIREIIRRSRGGREPAFKDVRQSVSPL